MKLLPPADHKDAADSKQAVPSASDDVFKANYIDMRAAYEVLGGAYTFDAKSTGKDHLSRLAQNAALRFQFKVADLTKHWLKHAVPTAIRAKHAADVSVLSAFPLLN